MQKLLFFARPKSTDKNNKLYGRINLQQVGQLDHKTFPDSSFKSVYYTSLISITCELNVRRTIIA